ncbi:TPA: hypothetical protein ACJ3H4_001588, partial [Neisseria meningitidis]
PPYRYRRGASCAEKPAAGFVGVNRFTRAVQKICRLNGFQTAWLLYSGLTKIRTRRRSRRQYK